MLTTVIALACSWCQRAVERPLRAGDNAPVYCSRLHRDWAEAVATGKFPATDCPRCGRHDLRIAAPDWGICQTCGFQTDRPNLEPGRITPANMFNNNSDLRKRLAS